VHLPHLAPGSISKALSNLPSPWEWRRAQRTIRTTAASPVQTATMESKIGGVIFCCQSPGPWRRRGAGADSCGRRAASLPRRAGRPKPFHARVGALQPAHSRFALTRSRLPHARRAKILGPSARIETPGRLWPARLITSKGALPPSSPFDHVARSSPTCCRSQTRQVYRANFASCFEGGGRQLRKDPVLAFKARQCRLTDSRSFLMAAEYTHIVKAATTGVHPCASPRQIRHLSSL